MKKVVLLMLLVAGIGVFIWWQQGASAVNTQDKSKKSFVVKKGQTIGQIGENLKAQGLIHNTLIFRLYVKQANLKNIQAGDFILSASMNLKQVIYTLGHGTADIWVTIPEGMRAEEIADILQKEIPSYDESWRATLVKNEGYLFPDTYLIPRDTTVDTVVSIMRNNFDKKIQEAGLSNRFDLEKIIIIASLIEREALRDNEKPTIASVITNRLRQGMALDIDATLQYAKGKVGDKWWTVPTAADKNMNSLYNTYRNPGLPPGPIGNPGIEAIKAAANPDSTNYFFYLHDSKRNVHFSRTIEEHQQNIRKYL